MADSPTTNGSTKVPVTMTDGRVVEFNQKQKLIKSSEITDKGDITVRLDFRNGETRTFVPPASLIARFAAHGIEQKLGDAIAGENDIDDAVASVDDLISRLSKGEWNITRAAGSFAGTSVLIRAIMEAREAAGSPTTVEEVKAFLADKSQAEKFALRRSDKLRPIVERLEAEKADKSKTSVDTGALLGEFGLGGAAKGHSKKAHEPA